MTELPPFPDGDDDDTGAHRGSTRARPRWASVVGISVAVVIVLIIVVLHLTGTIRPGGH